MPQHLPGILGEIQNERRGKPSHTSSPTSSELPKQQQRPVQRHPLDRFMPTSSQPVKISNVLSVKEAAAYLGVTPEEILGLIDAGKLPAARDSGGYRIARSVLDARRHNRRLGLRINRNTASMQPVYKARQSHPARLT